MSDEDPWIEPSAHPSVAVILGLMLGAVGGVLLEVGLRGADGTNPLLAIIGVAMTALGASCALVGLTGLVRS